MRPRFSRYPIAAAWLLAAGGVLGGCQTKQMVGNEASVDGAKQVCSSCHGLQGRSDNPTFPILAGQRKEYLQTQLHAFHDKTRADPHAHTYMWGMAAKLDDKTIDGLAAFFAAQKPAQGSSQDPALVAAGEKIFKNGIDSVEVPACGACHGDHAEGTELAPRLADQHRAYLEGQLQAFKVNSRANETMHANAKGLNDQQVSEIAAYLSSL